jgi:hypothetical protein
MITTLKKLFEKKKSEEEAMCGLVELGSAIKQSGISASKRTESWVGYFGTTGSVGQIGPFGTSGATGIPASFKIDDEVKIRPYSPDYIPELAPPGSYPDCGTVMFQTHEWIKRDYLQPIGRSRVTGETIYKYTGFNSYQDLDSIGIDYYELM